MLILANHEEGKSYSEIVGTVQRSKSVVYHEISRFKADKTLEPAPKTGRPPMTIKREDWMIIKMSLKSHLILQHLFVMHFVSKQESQSQENCFS